MVRDGVACPNISLVSVFTFYLQDMKFLFRLFFMIIILIFFGWIYIVYLYLHNENKDTLENIKDDLSKEVGNVKKQVKKQKESLAEVLADRQGEIAKFIKSMQKEAFEIKDIAQRFKNVSERTLRRDMQKLEKMGMIKQVGTTRNSKYKIIV